MNEVVFAKQFLASLDSNAAKFPPDYHRDSKQYPPYPSTRFLLPKLPYPYHQPVKQPPVPGQGRKVSVALKTLRDPILHFRLTQDPTATIGSVREEVASQASLVAAKIKLLYRKKPVSDEVTLAELLEGEEQELSMSVLLMPGAVRAEKAEPQENGSRAAKTILKTEEFWEDLQGFVSQRIKDDAVAAQTVTSFRKSLDC